MPPKILVVYDDPSTLELIVEALTSLGVEVRSVNNSLEAANLASQEKFDGIFVDPMMPIVDGCELAHRIRQSSWNRSTSIVIITVRDDKTAMAQAFEAAGSFILQEPIDRDSLTRLLNRSRGFMPEERRLQKRIPLSTEVTRQVGSVEITGMSSDLTEDGILFQGDGSLEMGNKVRLTFSLPDQKPAMEVEGIVFRVDAKQRVGVGFSRIAKEDRQRIKNFLVSQED